MGWDMDKQGRFYTAEVIARGRSNTLVTVFDSIGQSKDTVFSCLDGTLGGIMPISGVGVDPAGNLFVGINLRPFGVFYPKEFVKPQPFLLHPMSIGTTGRTGS